MIKIRILKINLLIFFYSILNTKSKSVFSEVKNKLSNNKMPFFKLIIY